MPPVSLTTSCRSAIASLKPGSPRVYSMFASASFLSASPWYARFRVRRGFLERPRPSEPLGAEEPEPFRAAPRNSANCGFFASISSLSSACMSRSSDAPYPEDRFAALTSMPRLGHLRAEALLRSRALPRGEHLVRFRAARVLHPRQHLLDRVRLVEQSLLVLLVLRRGGPVVAPRRRGRLRADRAPRPPPPPHPPHPPRTRRPDRAASSSDATRRPRDDITRVRDRAPRRLRTRAAWEADLIAENEQSFEPYLARVGPRREGTNNAGARDPTPRGPLGPSRPRIRPAVGLPLRSR